MRAPIAIEINNGSAYVHYSYEEVGTTVDLDPSCSVAADVARDESVVGIELLDVADENQILVARSFATRSHLGFPSDLFAPAARRGS